MSVPRSVMRIYEKVYYEVNYDSINNWIKVNDIYDYYILFKFDNMEEGKTLLGYVNFVGRNGSLGGSAGLVLSIPETFTIIEYVIENYPDVELKIEIDLQCCSLCLLKRKIYKPYKETLINDMELIYESIRTLPSNIETKSSVEDMMENMRRNRLLTCGHRHHTVCSYLYEDFDRYTDIKADIHIRWYLDEENDYKLVVLRGITTKDEDGSCKVEYDGDVNDNDYQQFPDSEDMISFYIALMNYLLVINDRINELQNKRRFSKAKSARK